MKDVLLVVAGIAGMTISVIHGVLGVTHVVGPSKTPNAGVKRIMHAVWFLSALYWFAGGAVLAAAPFVLDEGARRAAVIAVGALWITGVIANFWATRGRHFGWVLLAAATLIAAAGA